MSSPFVAVLVIALSGVALPARAAEQPTVARYAAALATAQPALSPGRRTALAERVTLISAYYRLDPALLMALISVESAWHPLAQSPVGAVGLGQLMPDTAAALDVLPLRVEENLDGTARYLRRMLDRFGSSERLALAAYNAGPAAVARFHGVPPYHQTQAYVVNVMELRARLAGAAATPAQRVVAPVDASPQRVAIAHARAQPRSATVARAPRANTAYVRAPDPNGVAFSDVPTPEPGATAAPARFDASTSIARRLFGRRK